MIQRALITILLSLIILSTHAVHAAQGKTLNSANNGPLRVAHFVLRNVSLESARAMVDLAQNAGFNAIQVVLTDGVSFKHAPWKPLKNAWTKAEFISWMKYARSRGLEVIPEIKLLTHQEKFFQDQYPELMFNKSTYDPRNEKTFKVVFTFLNEIIEAIQPTAIHIGHDEVAGHNPHSAKKWLPPGEKMLPADLFLQNVTRLHTYLKQKGVDTWMWGDMLLSPHEFPGMQSIYLHGTSPGYGKALRNQVPKDIVICDWHYTGNQTDFTSLSTLQREGFRVIGATWKNQKTIRNFSRYAKAHNAYGMMATTWFHVQRNETDLVNWIIRTSGLLFRNPDAAISMRPN